MFDFALQSFRIQPEGLSVDRGEPLPSVSPPVAPPAAGLRPVAGITHLTILQAALCVLRLVASALHFLSS